MRPRPPLVAQRRQAAASHAGRHAFTLIEVLLAASAAALIFVAIFGFFTSAIHLRNRATQHVQDARIRLRAEAIIRNDLQNAYISGGVPGTDIATILTATQESHGSSFPGYLNFTATTAELKDDQVGGDIEGIEYYIAKDPNATGNSSGILVRTETRVLLSPTQYTPPEEPILPGVNAVEFTFYDGNNWDTSWSYVNQGDPLPLAIRMHIEFAPAERGGAAPAPLEILVPWSTAPFTPAPAAATTPTTTQ